MRCIESHRATPPEIIEMLDTADLRTLSLWCRQHRMSWMPGCSDSGEGGLLLRGVAARCPTTELLLLTDQRELRLIGDGGETMASASTLPALLDALDAGVAYR